MKLIIATRRATLRIDKARVRILLEALLANALPHREHMPAACDTLSLILTGDTEIARVNQRALNHTGATDVITLTYAETPATPAVVELFVNVQRAAESTAGKDAWTPDHELARYIAHGLNHLSGHDDATPHGRRRMHRRERRWIRNAEADGLITGLFI